MKSYEKKQTKTKNYETKIKIRGYSKKKEAAVRKITKRMPAKHFLV